MLDYQGHHLILLIYPPASAASPRDKLIPSGFAAGFQRLRSRRFGQIVIQMNPPVSLRLSHIQLLILGLERGITASAALLIWRSRHRPHSGTLDSESKSLPSHWLLSS
jgi:hypothetical protein